MVSNSEFATFFSRRPSWVKGSIRFQEALFLRDAILDELPSIVLEIGTGSGLSAACICHSLESASKITGCNQNYRVISYDCTEVFYADHSRHVGDAARELLDDALLAHIEFRHPLRAADVLDHFPDKSVSFILIDANHHHPWPTLDLLAVSRLIRPGGLVFLHDINLPYWSPYPPCWGVHYLFNALDLEKYHSPDLVGLSNMGMFLFPPDTSLLRRQLVKVLNAHPWEVPVDDQYLARLGLIRSSGVVMEQTSMRRYFSFLFSRTSSPNHPGCNDDVPISTLPSSYNIANEALTDQRCNLSPHSELLPDWRSVVVPHHLMAVPTMLLPSEIQLLYSIAQSYYSNTGVIVDAGCFLGGSTLALATGVMDNEHLNSYPSEHVIYSYDTFIVQSWMIGQYFSPGTQTFEPHFRSNISPYSSLVSVFSGDVTTASLPVRDIEILFIDLAKHWTLSDYIVQNFFPRLIPGKSLVIQQDYLFHYYSGWLPVVMEYLSDYFELIDHTVQNSAVFFYKNQAPLDLLSQYMTQSLSRHEMQKLSDRAIQRFDRPQQLILSQAWDHFQQLLERESR